MRACAAFLAAVLLIGLGVASALAQGPGVVRTRLPNGLTVLVRENAVAPVVGMGIGIASDGTVFEGGEGTSGLIVTEGEDQGGEGSEESKKKKPMVQVKSDKDGGKS